MSLFLRTLVILVSYVTYRKPPVTLTHKVKTKVLPAVCVLPVIWTFVSALLSCLSPSALRHCPPYCSHVTGLLLPQDCALAAPSGPHSSLIPVVTPALPPASASTDPGREVFSHHLPPPTPLHLYCSLHISPSDVFVCCLLIRTILRSQGFCAFCSYYILNTFHSMCHMAGVQWIFVQQNK